MLTLRRRLYGSRALLSKRLGFFPQAVQALRCPAQIDLLIFQHLCHKSQPICDSTQETSGTSTVVIVFLAVISAAEWVIRNVNFNMDGRCSLHRHACSIYSAQMAFSAVARPGDDRQQPC